MNARILCLAVLPAAMIWCAAARAEAQVKDVSVEAYRQVVEYYRPKRGEALELERRLKEDGKRYVIVYCTTANDVPAGDPRFVGTPFLTEADGTEYPAIGNAYNSYTRCSQVVLQRPLWWVNVNVAAGKSEKRSWVFLVPENKTAFTFELRPKTGAALTAAIKVPADDTRMLLPKFVSTGIENRAAASFGVPEEGGKNVLVLKFDVQSSEAGKSLILNTPAITLEMADGTVLQPLGELSDDGKRITSHVSHLENAELRPFSICFRAPADLNGYKICYSGQGVWSKGPMPKAPAGK